MPKTEPSLQTNKIPTGSLAKYLAGDVVIFSLWALLLGFSFTAAQHSSVYLFPLWLYLGLCLMGLLIPRVKPGVYRLDSAKTSLWFISFQFGRIWGYPPIRHLIFSSALLRTIFLRCCGAKISMNVGWSAVTTLSDPSMLDIEENVIIGIESLFSGHTIIDGKLFLGKITLRRGSLVSARCALGPRCTVGEDAMLLGGVSLLPGAYIPKGARIGMQSTITAQMKLEEGKTYPSFMTPNP